MSKNFRHMSNIHEAAQELHRLFLGSSWYIRCQVMSLPPEKSAATDKKEKREIVVYVNDLSVNPIDNFNSWPVRYEKGA